MNWRLLLRRFLLAVGLVGVLALWRESRQPVGNERRQVLGSAIISPTPTRIVLVPPFHAARPSRELCLRFPDTPAGRAQESRVAFRQVRIIAAFEPAEARRDSLVDYAPWQSDDYRELCLRDHGLADTAGRRLTLACDGSRCPPGVRAVSKEPPDTGQLIYTALMLTATEPIFVEHVSFWSGEHRPYRW